MKESTKFTIQMTFFRIYMLFLVNIGFWATVDVTIWHGLLFMVPMTIITIMGIDALIMFWEIKWRQERAMSKAKDELMRRIGMRKVDELIAEARGYTRCMCNDEHCGAWFPPDSEEPCLLPSFTEEERLEMKARIYGRTY